jgi:hypothetical protein
LARARAVPGSYNTAEHGNMLPHAWLAVGARQGTQREIQPCAIPSAVHLRVALSGRHRLRRGRLDMTTALSQSLVELVRSRTHPAFSPFFSGHLVPTQPSDRSQATCRPSPRSRMRRVHGASSLSTSKSKIISTRSSRCTMSSNTGSHVRLALPFWLLLHVLGFRLGDRATDTRSS